MCHVYGYTPADVLHMAYTHFLTLVEYLDRVEREHAKYAALAFNNPNELLIKEKEVIDLRTEKGRQVFLAALQGKK